MHRISAHFTGIPFLSKMKLSYYVYTRMLNIKRYRIKKIKKDAQVYEQGRVISIQN